MPTGSRDARSQCRADGQKAGAFTVDSNDDAANAVFGAILLGVLGRSMTGADATDPRFQQQLTDQAVRGILTR